MKSSSLLPVLTVLMLSACGGGTATDEAPSVTFTIDDSRITTSGVSAGGYMAGQLHIAHSSVFDGVGIIAAGPYYCASGSMQTGLGPCMKGGDLRLESLWAYLVEQAAAGRTDSTDNLADDTAWIFLGANDEIINKDVTDAASEFYGQYLAGDAIVYVDDIEAPHGMPTIDAGVACDAVEAPYLNACGYDAAGELLKTLNGTLEPRTTATGELISIPQPGGEDADMLATALLYVPQACASGEPCGVHVALHGCQQSTEFIDNAFAAGAGYNEWAESNRLLVLYPQVASSKMAPLNPLGCWDWWGYTGDDYATRSGAQIASIMATLESLRGANE